MQIVFFGAGKIAALLLQRLSEAHDMMLTVTPPPRPAGRKMIKQQCPAAVCATRLNLPLHETAAPADVPALYAKTPPELVVVCDYGLLLPPNILNWSPMGALNMHPSLLPRWRGAAPIERAILAGDSETGVTIMQMNEELDAGDIIRQQKISISPDATGGALSESLAETGAILMIKVLNNLAASSSYPQPAERVSYAAKISAAERVLDFNQPADFVAGQVRAFAPFPGAHTYINGVIVKARLAVESEHSGAPGEILAVGKNGITVACAKHAITLLRLQRAGRQELCAEGFLRGFPLSIGEKAGIINAPPR